MKILFLSFYFEPDLSAGSFRNSTLSKELSEHLNKNDRISIITTMPNRYFSYTLESKRFEKIGNVEITRIRVPKHRNGLIKQVFSFITFFFRALKITRNEEYDLVYASSGRLFTAFLGSYISRNKDIPLYLDIRDIFLNDIQVVFKKSFFTRPVVKLLKLIEKYTFSKAVHINLISQGFESYFKQYTKPSYSYFSNGIDSDFLDIPISTSLPQKPFIITYAGNIGKGQGLEKIVPLAAKILNNNYRFRIIGDGGMKEALIKKLYEYDVHNVEIIAPLSRHQLIKYYSETHFLFLHLNNYSAFEKVLPSKIFEYAATDKPIIAGVSGYAKKFIHENLTNYIIFQPGDVAALITELEKFKFSYVERSLFKHIFDRKKINEKMVKSILNYVKI